MIASHPSSPPWTIDRACQSFFDRSTELIHSQKNYYASSTASFVAKVTRSNISMYRIKPDCQFSGSRLAIQNLRVKL